MSVLVVLLVAGDAPHPIAPPDSPGTTGTLLSYVAFALSIATPIAAGVAAWRRSHSRREQLAMASKTEAEAGSVTSGITLEGWRESRQEVHDARADARDARQRAEKLSARLDECEAENRALRAQVAVLSTQLTSLTDQLNALHFPPEDT